MNKNTIPNIWTAQEKVLHLYKVLALALGVFGFGTAGALVASGFRNPIVVVEKSHDVEFYPSERLRVTLTDADVERFAKEFLVALYVWKDFSGKRIAQAIGPFVEGELVPKAVEAQELRYNKELKGKHLAQSLVFVDLTVLTDRVTARFDRVLKIEGIPLIIPTEVTLVMVQGEQTRLNPMGIYVTGVTESQNAK